VAVAVGAAAVLIPLALEAVGVHYLISKNVTPALTVLLIAAGLILGAQRAPWLVGAGAGLACAFFLAITLAGPFSPSLQRPDYRDAARALGAPAPAQAVVVPRGGDSPLVLYRPGAAAMPAGGLALTQVVVIQPFPRADISSHRPATPAPPQGFALAGRRDAPRYTLICFSSPTPRPVSPSTLLALAGGPSASAQVWPGATGAPAPDLCTPSG
jgi:hypothetical protein